MESREIIYIILASIFFISMLFLVIIMIDRRKRSKKKSLIVPTTKLIFPETKGYGMMAHFQSPSIADPALGGFQTVPKIISTKKPITAKDEIQYAMVKDICGNDVMINQYGDIVAQYGDKTC